MEQDKWRSLEVFNEYVSEEETPSWLPVLFLKEEFHGVEVTPLGLLDDPVGITATPLKVNFKARLPFFLLIIPWQSNQKSRRTH